MEDREFRAALDLHWVASDVSDFEREHEIYREDAVLEYPQSGERIRGRRNIQASRAAQPSNKRFTVRRILGDADPRHFDCAERYRNEQAVGDAMQDAFKAGVMGRKDVFVTTKLWNNNHRPERVAPAFEASRRRLQLDTLDCYLIHTPFAFQPGDEQEPKDERSQIVYDSSVTLVETWRALERLVDEGKCGAIGLSNVNLEKLREIVDAARIKPAVVEVESHPYLPEWELLDYCRQQGIVLLAFAALGHAMEPRLLDDPAIVAIARRLDRTPAQVALAWAVQRGTALLTTSVKPNRIRENFEVSALPEDAMQEIRNAVTTSVRFNSVVGTGVPGFIPRDR